MKRDIAEYVSLCDTYQRVKTEHQRTTRLLEPLKDFGMKMGRNRNGLHCWVTPYPSWIRLNLDHSGLVNEKCSLHSSQDNLFRS
jgi:hypothetical protein